MSGEATPATYRNIRNLGEAMSPEESKRLYYIRGTLRNRLHEQNAAYWNEEKALRYLHNMWPEAPK